MSTAQLASTLTYTPPGGGVNSATATLSVNSPYSALSAGFLDIPDTTAANTIFAIPFGTVFAASMLIMSNTNTQEMLFGIAGTSSQAQLPIGGQLTMACPSIPSASSMQAAECETSGVQSGAGTFLYFVFGD